MSAADITLIAVSTISLAVGILLFAAIWGLVALMDWLTR